MNRAANGMYAAAFLALAVLLGACSRGDGKLSASGTIEAVEVKVFSTVQGRVLEALAREGQAVEAGAPLARIDPESYRLQEGLAASGVDLAEAQLELLLRGARVEDLVQAEAALASAEEALAFAESDARRMRELEAAGSATKRQREDADARLSAAKAAREAANQSLKKLNSLVRPEELRAARARVEQARWSLRLARRALSECEIRSPVSGVVTARLAEAGELAAPGTGIALLSGRAEIVVAIPPGFSRELRSRASPQLGLLVDGSRSNTAAVALAYATGIASSFGARLSPTARPPGPSVDARIRVWYNPELRSRLFMVPGIFALLAMVFTIILTALAVVKEKEAGTLEQLMASPLRRGELVAGKLAPFLLVSTVTLTLALVAVRVFFGIAPRGSLVLLALLSVLFSVSTLGIGLFVSTLARTQQQAMLFSIFFFMFPMMILSGFVFPIENMPAAIRAVTCFMPLRYYLRIVRSLFLKGSGLAVLWPEALALAGLAALYVSVAVARFRKRM